MQFTPSATASTAQTFLLAKCKRTASMTPIADRADMVRDSYPFGSEHMHSGGCVRTSCAASVVGQLVNVKSDLI